MTSNESFIVDHQSDSCRFTIPNTQAVLEYQLDSKQGRVDFSRTFVPQDMRGSGAAQALVSAGLRWAREEALTIEASCWYVDKFLRRKRS
ncbi:GNAT family N-acetyltransferase [Pseudoteredinibacter isoporae]|uniref:GNAT family N-acetyltransferase n=1 Tax=Pseudoteredinibacter isoporae TaxID=570281 RepID=UPI00310988C2